MDYKIQLNHIRENCCLTKIPNDANAFLVLSVINNLWQKDKASDSLIILENDVEVSRFIEQVNFLLAFLLTISRLTATVLTLHPEVSG